MAQPALSQVTEAASPSAAALTVVASDTELQQRARDLLAKLSIVAEGSVTKMDSDGAHEKADSRPPVSLERIDAGQSGRAPAKERDLHGHWRHRFAQEWRRPDRLYLCVLLATEDLLAAHHPGQRGVREATESEILAFRGEPAEAAAKFKVTIKYVEIARYRNRIDPQTGDPWLWPDREARGRLSPEAVERAKAFALQVARDMLAEGTGYRRIRDATGVPIATLSRSFATGSNATMGLHESGPAAR